MPRRRSLLLAALASGLLTVSLTACSTSSTDDRRSPSGRCVPLVAVEPQDASPGEAIAVTFPGGCQVAIPAEGLEITAAPVGDPDSAVRVTIPAGTTEPVRAELVLPDGFPLGEAWAGIADWDYSSCPDDASCASPTGSFTVVPG